jgi:signal peptidase II
LLLKSVITLLIIFLIVILTYEFHNDQDSWLLLSLSFIIGGAIGNYIDRIQNGYVTDFLYIKYRSLPVFNVADVFIFMGAILLLLFSTI